MMIFVVTVVSMKVTDTKHILRNNKNISILDEKIKLLENDLELLYNNIGFCSSLDKLEDKDLYCKIFNLQREIEEPIHKLYKFSEIIDGIKHSDNYLEDEDIFWNEDDEGERYEFNPNN